MKEIRLGDLMVNSGYITEQQLMEALALQKQDRSKRIGQILIEQGYVQERQMLTALADRLQTSLIDISTYPVEEEAVKTIPIQMAQHYMMLPVSLQEGLLTVAMNDPLNLYAIEDLRQTTGMNVHTLLAESQPLKDAITYHYAAIKTKQAAANASENASASSETQEVIIDANVTADDAPIINLVNSLLDKAYQDGVSDVHIEPFEKEILVRMRTDGVLLNYMTLNKNVQNALVARIKIIGELDIAERRVPQDGHFRIRIRDQIVNVRVSVIPTVFGEKVVMRILASNSDIDHSDTFGMTPNNYQKFIKMLKSPNGLIYITGPTGSGKTTTLYMALGSLATKPVNISTIEDPVEKNLAHLNQMQVHPTAGLTFEVGLRALLRQDPDVIMVGETRDPETASISLRAAITGHLVLSTLHTNDAVSTIIRLIDMGAEPYLLSSALVGAVAQRLLRKVCPYCGQVVGLDDNEREFAGRDIPTAKRAVGCAKCHNTGYAGRIAVHEVLVADKNVRAMIAAGATAEEITKYAVQSQGMESIKMAGLRLLEEGVTTMEEVQRIAYNE
ncbi:MAG: type II/IV secretion system protein [Lachnospiraceae bacterium]|nr:type II/IV secretion system protein [Lachnospiraceae bacterium]